MVIFGGLEFIAGGYLLHRYHKKKNEKRRLEDEAYERRNHTFPGAKPQNPSYHQQPVAQLRQQKHACYAQRPQPSSPCRRPVPAQYSPRPQPPQHHHERPPPVAYHQQQLIQPLQRADSFASTLSTSPVANGPRYTGGTPPLPPRRQQSSQLTIPRRPVNGPYNNAGFSVSVPALGQLSTPFTERPPQLGRRTVDDNWETYSPHSPHVRFANVATEVEDDENDPPPAYQP